MVSSKNAKESPPLIKGYLPVRLHLPSGEETFFYVKEHQSSKIPVQSDDADDGAAPPRTKQQRRGGGSGGSSDTLFVVNAPVVPPVRSKALLQAIFGRYADVERVAVIENPRTGGHNPLSTTAAIEVEPTWTPQFAAPSCLPVSPQRNDGTGKYAHVVFASPNDMKRALRAVTGVMTSSSSTRRDQNGLPALSLDANGLLALQDEPDPDNSHTIEPVDHKTSKSRVLRVAERYRQSQRRLASERAALLETCNVVMRDFEHAEDVERKTREEAANQPDEDGFTTVTYSTNHGPTSAVAPASSSKRQLDEDANHRRKGAKRLRKKKGHGASELDDFYRFQTKQERKKTLQELRQGFEEDLARIRKMKEERKCLPF